MNNSFDHRVIVFSTENECIGFIYICVPAYFESFAIKHATIGTYTVVRHLFLTQNLSG